MNTAKNWKQITKDNYNINATEFASFSSTYRGKMQAWTEQFANLFAPGSSILDIGCGAGRDAAYFVQKGLAVTGIDFSEKLIDIVKEKVPAGKFFVIDFEDLSFPEESFDGAWANASLYHIPKTHLAGVFQKVHDVLKKGGIFLSTYRVGEGEKFMKEKRGNATLERFGAYYQPEEIEKILHQAGFGSIKFDLDHIETGDWMRFLARK